MGKFRSKLKRHTKGKKWGHGLSATSNPETTKHRSKARSRFFQPNLSLAPTQTEKESPLTLDAIIKHDARQSFASGNAVAEPTVNDIATSLKSFNFNTAFGDDDENMSESQSGTFKTYKTFASTYSTCTNMSFSKLLNGFRSDSTAHKEMLAILAALTDVIKERGGSQSSTEYFLALMETIEATKQDNEIIAAVSLLSMGIKTVPEAILRKQFSESAEVLLDLMKQYNDTDNQNVLRAIISCLSALLRAQEYSLWKLSTTLEYFNAILAFTIHSKPKIRKSAQHAITSIIHGSCFMAPPLSTTSESLKMPPPQSSTLTHPAGSRITKFAIQQFKPDNIANSQTVVLHTLALLRDTLYGLKTEDIKTICEHLLSIMTAANVLIRTNCFHVLHSLFSSNCKNLTPTLIGGLITAIYDYRPDKTDVRQTLAWLTVLKQAHICLATFDLSMCLLSTRKLIEICANDLWTSERVEVVSGASNAIKDMFSDCLRCACETEQLAHVHEDTIRRCISSVAKGLSAPFGHVSTQVVLTFSTVFEMVGKYFAEALIEPLRIIGQRYDPDSSTRLQIEHAVLSAIPTMGPIYVLKAIPLVDGNNQVDISRTWILPLLREAVTGSTLEFFFNDIFRVACQCQKLWKKEEAAKNVAMSHTYELLWCQLWGLFPGFCRKPTDIHNFRYIAKSLGTALNENPEVRSPVLDGLKELMTNAEDVEKAELARYAKNFLPRLFNIYTTKPTGSYEGEQRIVTFDVIKEYLKITPKDIHMAMFESAKEQQKTLEAGTFAAEAIFDIMEYLALYQTAEQLKSIFNDFITPVLKKTRKPEISKNVEKLKRQQRKCYEMLSNIMTSENDGCLEFVTENITQIQDLVLGSLKTTCNTTQAARLNCIKIIIEKIEDLSVNSKLIKRTIPEIVVAFNHGAIKRENVAMNLIITIGELYQKTDQLNKFIDILLVGFGGDTVLITNTILTITAVVKHFTGNLTVATLQFILEQVLVFLVGKNRQEVEASLAFVTVFVKVLPTPLVANHLTTIVRSLSSMVPDTKRHGRIAIGMILKKLCKKFTAEEIIKLVPGDDEITHKKLKNIRKTQNRAKRQKQEKQNADDDESDTDLEDGLKKVSHTIDDILGDSDSDFDEMETDGPSANKSNKRSKKQETFIQEDPESILDLADVNAIGKITTSKPTNGISNLAYNKDKKSKDSNRGFKTAMDGRLIIDEPKFHRGAANSDSDDNDDEVMVDGISSTPENGAKKRSHDADSDDSDSANEQTNNKQARKRKASDLQSMASGRSGSKYQAGGKGIHRPLGGGGSDAASAKSGMSRMSMATTKSASTVYGSAYKAKKARGDMKQSGKADPFAYIPLSRNSLNKRKRSKVKGQFNSIVAGARKGAAAGSKNRIQKSYKKQKPK